MLRRCQLPWIVFSLTINLLPAQIGPPPSAPQTPRATQLPLEARPPNAGAANPGSVPSGTVTAQPLSLSLEDAIQRGLRQNLSIIGTGDSARYARAQRLSTAAQLLPDINGTVRETVQQIDLAAMGFRVHVPIPGFDFPSIVGPFNYFDARANFGESVSLTGLRNWRAARENVRSADLSVMDAKEIVALAVAGQYLQIGASASRIDTVKAQIETARAVYQQAVDRNKSGLNARIDVNRSLVELQNQQQRLTAATNDFEKQKLALARLIGLPLAQSFTLADTIPYRELPPAALDTLIQRALAERADVRAAAAQVHAAELARKAAIAERYPWVDLTADYGAIGTNPSQSHGTFGVTGAVRFPIFRSGRTEADIEAAAAVLAQRKAEYEDLRGRAEQDVRVAMLDLTSAAEQVRVAESNRKLAGETIEQARDRFRAGVADTIEVVQAQESVASAEQDYINALYMYNLANVSLARAAGQTAEGIARLLRGR